ncbi:AraC family transcriptional regulator [Pseudofulvibacter geojedonensis]|uniref:AraC family transcriptional regulator n=1 Tax=Pseudofulvibacter geojedonensis TaxID=1123758 RepID=A0ABW3I5P9_9FLAO
MSLLPVLHIKEFSKSIKRDDFYANIFSTHLKKHHSSITKPHKHNFYLIVLFLKGKGVHEVDFNSYPIKRGALFLLKPGQTHHWEFSEEAEGFIFFHSKEFYNLLFPNKNIDEYPVFYSSYNSPYIQLEKDLILEFKERFNSIYQEYKQNNLMKYRKLGLLVDLLYIDATRAYKIDNTTEVGKVPSQVILFRKLEVLINEKFLVDKSPSSYAKALHVSTKHLNRVVFNTLNISTSDLIHQRVLLEAKRLLTHGEMSIQQIAFELGYNDPSYFTRLFKKKVGVTPSVFIDRYKENDKS